MPSQGSATKWKKSKQNPSRVSEPGPASGLSLKNKLKPCTKSAGNSPATSPTLSRKVLLNSSKLDNSHNDTLSIDITGIDESDLTTSKLAVDVQPGTNEGEPTCPCSLSLSKNSVFIKCTGCSQDWHCSCVNLAGISVAGVKKLASWKCPRCYSSPFSTETGKSNDAFEEFKHAMSHIEELTDELKGSSTSVEFFNMHLKHLLLNPSEFTEHSARISAVEKGISDIKLVLENLPSTITDHCGSSVISNCAQSDVAEELLEVRRNIEGFMNHGEAIERSNKQARESMQVLQNLLEQANASHLEVKTENVNNLHLLDTKIALMSEQLVTLNQYVSPATFNRELITPDPNTDDRIPMTPNTISPHMLSEEPSTDDDSDSNSAGPHCDPYVSYKESAITQEMKDKLLEFVQDPQTKFNNVGESRDVMYVGEFGYWYTGAYHPAAETPEVIQDLLEMARPCLTNEKAWINSCLITRYKNNSDHIPLHRDNELYIDPESEILSVSIGAERKIKFIDNEESSEVSLTLADSSGYVISRYSQDYWRHGIDAVNAEESDNHVTEEPEPSVRYSFTFRHIAPHFRNSTLLIGDSNTKYCEFGTQNYGKFGRWMPGKRIKASKVEDIPEPSKVGPFRNVVIHTGINNLTDRVHPNKVIGILKRKCNAIIKTYPNCKLHLSLLLPTKSYHVNSKVNELNSLILEFAYGKKNMFIVDNNNLADERGCLPPDMGRYAGGHPRCSDIVHLGRKGISKFCSNIKKGIVPVKKGTMRSQSTERFNGGQGNYRAAAHRGLNATHRVT